MMLPDFTVLMAVYGGDDANFFSKALNSVFANSRLPSAVVLVVDGPVPPSIQCVIEQHHQRPGMFVVHLTQNLGLAAALNAGLAYVTTEWVVRADSDDFNHTNRFEILCAAMSDNVDILGSSIREVERNGELICERRMPLQHEDITKFMRRRNPFNHMSVAYRLNLVRHCGGYPLVHLREDYALWIRMSSLGARMLNLPHTLVDATTGRDMYERRGGLRYAIGEWGLQSLLVQEGVKSPFLAAVDFILRSSIFLAPRRLRRAVYENFLRHRPENISPFDKN